MWRKYFNLVKLVPGKVITQTHGTIDFSGDVPVETCKELYEQDFPYLEITEKGKEKLYGIKIAAAKKKETSSNRKTTRKKRKSPARTYKRRSSDTDS